MEAAFNVTGYSLASPPNYVVICISYLFKIYKLAREERQRSSPSTNASYNKASY